MTKQQKLTLINLNKGKKDSKTPAFFVEDLESSVDQKKLSELWVYLRTESCEWGTQFMTARGLDPVVEKMMKIIETITKDNWKSAAAANSLMMLKTCIQVILVSLKIIGEDKEKLSYIIRSRTM